MLFTLLSVLDLLSSTSFVCHTILNLNVSNPCSGIQPTFVAKRQILFWKEMKIPKLKMLLIEILWD